MDDFGSPSPAISPRPSQNLRGLKLGAIEENAGRAANLAGPKSPLHGIAPPQRPLNKSVDISGLRLQQQSVDKSLALSPHVSQSKLT